MTSVLLNHCKWPVKTKLIRKYLKRLIYQIKSKFTDQRKMSQFRWTSCKPLEELCAGGQARSRFSGRVTEGYLTSLTSRVGQISTSGSLYMEFGNFP